MAANPLAKVSPGVTVADLPQLTGVRPLGPQPFLYCPGCGEHYSATRGDYFMLPPDHLMTCANGHRRRRMYLATERRSIEPWTGAGA